MNAATLPSEAVPAQASSVKRRLYYIDALRGAACLWVLVHHSFALRPTPAGFWHYPAAALVRVADVGWLGVSMFLVLSGFCLFYPLVSRNKLSEIKLNIAVFARRRALRILPPYYAAFILLAVLEITLNYHHSGHWDWNAVLHGRKDILLHLFMLHNLRPDTIGSVSPAFWSLALECQLYLIFPILVWAAARYGLRLILAATLLISLCWQSFCFHHLGFSLSPIPKFAVYYHALPGRCFEFAAGMVAAYFVASPRPGQRRIAAALILIPIVPALYFVSRVSWFGPLCDQVWGTIFAATLVLLGELPDVRFQQNFALRSFVWVGAISYSIYLMHQPFIMILSPHLLHLPAGTGSVFVAGLIRLPLLVGIGYLFHLAFERPFMPGHPRTERQTEVVAALSPAL